MYAPTPEISMAEVMRPTERDSQFPFSPVGWRVEDAIICSEEENVSLSSDHYEVIRILQHCFACEEQVRMRRFRQLHDIMAETFHAKGGLRYLYELFPGGPIAQGCRFAGLSVPVGALDKSFGTVQ